MHTPLLNDPPVHRRAFDGDALLQRYRLEREAVHTDSGVLYDAVEIETLRPVTVEIANDLDGDARERFERDAMMAQRLEGEHVLHVVEVGALLDGTPYVVREPSLGHLAADVETRGPLPTAEAVALTLEVCEALAEAHTRGMAHGDVRGETVFLARDAAGNPIAKLKWASRAKAERAAREDVARDIAAAGMLLRFLVSGQREVEEEGAKTLPSDLALAVARATAKDDRSRFRNIGDLAAAVARYAPPGHTAARNIALILSRAGIIGGLASGPPASVRPRTRVASQPGLNDAWFEPRASRTSMPPAAPRRSGRFAAVSLLLLAGTAIGTVALWRTGNLPTWSGTAPAILEEDRLEPVSRTTLTAADVGDTTAMTPPPPLTAAVTAEPARAAAAPVTPTGANDEATEEAPPAHANRLTPPAGDTTPASKAKTAPAASTDDDTAAEPSAPAEEPSAPAAPSATQPFEPGF